MLDLAKVANRYKFRLQPDGVILFSGASKVLVELYTCCGTEIYFYLKKGSLHRALVKIGGIIHQEGDIEVVLTFPEKDVDKIIDFVISYLPMK